MRNKRHESRTEGGGGEGSLILCCCCCCCCSRTGDEVTGKVAVASDPSGFGSGAKLPTTPPDGIEYYCCSATTTTVMQCCLLYSPPAPVYNERGPLREFITLLVVVVVVF